MLQKIEYTDQPADEIDEKDLSVTLTSFFMKFTGFWLSDNPAEKIRRDVAFYYSIVAVGFAIVIELLEFKLVLGDFGDMTYVGCNLMTLMMVQYKFSILSIQRSKFFDIILYTQKNFWHSDYDEYGTRVVQSCRKRCVLFVCSFTFFALGTVCCYTITPILANVGKNDSDRILPFMIDVKLFLNTPYYEILFFVEVLSLLHVGICYFCFDNFICILNVHAAGQFRILQNRFTRVCDGLRNYRPLDSGAGKASLISPKGTTKLYENFKRCVRQHQILIEYAARLEDTFTMIVLGQVLMFSVLLCLVGYQILLGSGPSARKAIFMCHMCGTMVQLLMMTFTCNGLIEESKAIVPAAYSAQWPLLPMDKHGRELRRDLRFVIMRSQRPCCITAGGFFPVSLETFTTVLSTALSYFTLLRQQNDQITRVEVG